MTTPTTGVLHSAHLEELQASKIGPKRSGERGYRTVTDPAELPPEFADYQRRPGLLIPISTVRGEVESYQLKPFQPRIGSNGKPIKYETAANAPQVLDVPASVIEHLASTKLPLIITEGAKKVDSALSNGLPSTIGLQGVYGWRGTNAQGGKTALADWEQIALNGRQVLIAFDSDCMSKPEVADARNRLTAFLRSRGAKVFLLQMPDLPDGSKCGLDDWFASGKSRADLQNHMTLVRDKPAEEKRPLASPGAVPMVIGMNQIEEREIDWLWPGWIPKGMITLLGGYAGDGKSTLTMSLAATLSTGGTLPDGTTAPTVNTLIFAAEDDPSYVVKPRLRVHGAEMSRISIMEFVRDAEGTERSVNLRRDIDALRLAIHEHEIGLVIMDPLSSYFAQGDRNNEGDVRDTLGPLVRTLQETGCAFIGIMHIGKNDGQAKAMQKLMGSTAFSALARSVIMVSELPEEFQAEGEATRKMLGVSKSNYGVKPAALTFKRERDAPISFLGTSPVNIEEVWSWKSKKDEKAPAEQDRAAEWLLEYMDGKPLPASTIEAAAELEGIRRTSLQVAKKRLGIASQRSGSGWMWLPPVDERIA